MVNVGVRSGIFWVIAVYAPDNREEHVSFFDWLGLFLVHPVYLLLMEDWNVILEPS